MRVPAHHRDCRYSPLFPYCDCGLTEMRAELDRLRDLEKQINDPHIYSRKPAEDDYKVFVMSVFDRSNDIDPDSEKDWNDIALGFLIARGVDPGFTNWELLSAFSCGDEIRMREALNTITAMTEPDRPEG